MSFCFSLGVSFKYTQDHKGEEDTAVDLKLYSHRWRRWLPQKQHSTDSNRASQEQDQDQELEPDALPGPLSAEDTDNSSHIEVGWSLIEDLGKSSRSSLSHLCY